MPEIPKDWERYHEGWFENVCVNSEAICAPAFDSEYEAVRYWDEEHNEYLMRYWDEEHDEYLMSEVSDWLEPDDPFDSVENFISDPRWESGYYR